MFELMIRPVDVAGFSSVAVVRSLHVVEVLDACDRKTAPSRFAVKEDEVDDTTDSCTVDWFAALHIFRAISSYDPDDSGSARLSVLRACGGCSGRPGGGANFFDFGVCASIHANKAAPRAFRGVPLYSVLNAGALSATVDCWAQASSKTAPVRRSLRWMPNL